MSTTPDPADDFDAGKAIFEKLKDIPQERQEKILRWVRENLGLSTRETTRSSAEPLTPELEESTTEQASDTEKAVDIRSFVESKKPRSDQQFAAVVAYYYRSSRLSGTKTERSTQRRCKKRLVTLNAPCYISQRPH
jgi:hypothetical protein